MIEFRMPSLGADMEEGKLLEWKMKPGDAVKRGDVVAVVDTSKAAVDVEIWQDGVVHELITQPGETVAVGTVMARLAAAGEEAVERKEAPIPVLRKPASPAARKRAHELDVDIEKLAGTGPHGAVTLEDVERSARKAPAVAPADKSLEMRKAIAAAMARSKREIPHYYLSQAIPMQRAAAWLAQENARRPLPERLLMGVLQLKAVALALADFPDLNGFWQDGAFRPGAGVHLGVAISLRQGGLIAPAIHDVDRLSLGDLMKKLSDLVKRARAGSLRSSEMSDPTLTVTNLGDQGVDEVFGIIYPPQVALVGFGRVAPRPWAEDGMLGARPTVVASLAGDHRASDGHRGALYLAAIARLLQEPEKL
jgi:pyruvate dehydrogenase E2 component (dihydrolipoamide acetyltransferase)